MNQAASRALTPSSPANGADEPPPHTGFDAPATTGKGPGATAVFGDDSRSQSTQIEQARAIAEVQAAVLVAQKCPRSMDRALEEMRKVCRIDAMAERAFFSFARGGENVTGATIHLARELARIWGNISYGVKELARNDIKGESEMLAYAWDLQTNVRPDTGFIVPHVRDTRKGRKPITDVRDIYENNANMGARRVRECIFAAIPKWFTDEAEDLCRQTLEAGGGVPIETRRKQAMERMAEIGVTPAMIEKKYSCALVNLTSTNIADMKIVYRSIKNREISKDEAFPETPGAEVTASLRDKVTAQGGTGTGGAPATSQPTAENQAKAAEPVKSEAKPTPEKPAAEAGPHDGTTKLLLHKIAEVLSARSLDAVISDYAEELDLMRTDAPDAFARVQDAISARREAFKGK